MERLFKVVIFLDSLSTEKKKGGENTFSKVCEGGENTFSKVCMYILYGGGEIEIKWHVFYTPWGYSHADGSFMGI
jgi:hypothetical protein